MAVDRSALLQDLGSLVGDLEPSDKASLDELNLARLALARALVGRRAEPLVSPKRFVADQTMAAAGVVAPAVHAGLSAALEKVLEEAAEAEPQFLVYRRQLPVHTTQNPSSLPSWATGRAIERSLGPFKDRLGRPVWIDLFRIVRTIRLVRAPGGRPFLTLPIRGLFLSGERYSLGPGSIWFASQMLAPGAPPDGYTGLRIKGGTLVFSQAVSGTGGEIVVPLAVICTISLELDPPAAASGVGPAGADARATVATLPAKATLVFGGGGARVESATDSQLDAYGSSVALRLDLGVPGFAGDVNRIFVPLKPEASQFAVLDERSALFEPAGESAIAGAAWALPVAMVAPDVLGEASGAGALAMQLAAGLTAQWQGQAQAIPLGAALLMGEPGRLVLVALAASGLDTAQTVTLWDAESGAGASSSLMLRYPKSVTVRFFSEASGVDALLLNGFAIVSANRPLTVQGERVPLHSSATLIALWQQNGTTTLLAEGIADPPADGRKALAFALTNAVMPTSPPFGFIVAGTYTQDRLTAGGLLLGFNLNYLLPTLPDPYAANITLQPRLLRTVGAGGLEAALAYGPGGFGVLLAVVVWQAPKPPTLDFVLPATAGLLTRASPRQTPATAAQGNVAEILKEDAGREQALSDIFDQSLGQRAGDLVLLDVSSNVDQFGVRFGVAARRGDQGTTAVAALPSALMVEELYLASAANGIRVVTLPAVQWEPVVTRFDPNDPAFPSPLSFANSGGPTALGVQTVELMRIAPQPALEQLVATFNRSPDPRPAAALFTLPFGIKAAAYLSHNPSPKGFQADLAFNRPKFSSASLNGGHQLRVEAIAAPGVVPGGTPGLEGATIQLRNGLKFGIPQGKSVLGSADITFNGNFAPGGTRQQVPVTRIDLSGYGESLFSDWRNPDDAAGIVTKATFDVLIGRTAYELIQIQSIIYPYAVRVIRTIVIQRENGGIVVRRDSGWQAVTEGRYLYPEADLKTHPGVVLGVRNVVNIREIGQTYTTAAGIVMMAVRFDCEIVIEGVGAGSVNSGVPSRNQLGFVQMTEESGRKAITPAELAELIDTFGPLCGPADCVIDIGASGEKMRVARVGVGVTQGMGGPEFAMAAWGSPALPRGGQWSFMVRTVGTDAAEPVDKDFGVPLVRAGIAPTPPPGTPYRFADPEDVNQPATPQREYGLLHATGTQRVLFRRPAIEAGSKAINSRPPSPSDPPMVPLLADPYGLAVGVGLFPRLVDAIPIPDPNWALDIAPDGNVKLSLASPNFTVTFGQRNVVSTGSVQSYAQYADENGVQSIAAVAIDSGAAVPWRVQISHVSFALSAGALGELVRLIADVDASAAGPLQLKNARLRLGGAFKPVQDVLDFLQSLGLPAPLTASMTNDWKLQVGLKVPLKDAAGEDLTIPPDAPEGQYLAKFTDAGVTVTETVANNKGTPFSEAECEMGATVLLQTQFDPLKAVGLFYLKIGLSSESGTDVTITWGGGLGVDIGIFTGYIAITNFLITGDTVFGLGGGAIVKLTFDFKIVEVDIKFEAKIAVVKTDCPAPDAPAIYGVAKATVGVEVSIFLVIDISFDYDWSWEERMAGGSCPLPDVV